MFPLPLTLTIFPIAFPLFVKVKSFMSTPVTASEKVTVYATLVALVGEVPARFMLLTVGEV